MLPLLFCRIIFEASIPSLILPIMKKTPWEAYIELHELDSIVVYKAHVKSSMNPD
jgi:hypothetical protein